MANSVTQGLSSTYSLSTLYVGDLHPDVNELKLSEKFGTAETVVSSRICRDMITQRSLGYGYVNFLQPADAERALDILNHEPLLGRPMRIMWKRRDPTLRKTGVGNLFIKNLDKGIDSRSLHDTFSAFGNILSCKVMTDDESKSLGYGFVHFEKEEAAKMAIEKVNGMLLGDKKVYVGPFIHRDKRQAIGESRLFTNVYIKNFADLLDDEKLIELLSPFGEITSCMVQKDNNGVSKGFGFCNFRNANDAGKCVEELQNHEIEGRKIHVGRFKSKWERAAERKRIAEERKVGRMKRYSGVNLYVKNLDDSIDDAKLREAFERFGTITSAKVMTIDGRSRGFGFVCFSANDEATRALTEMNGTLIGSKPLYVTLHQFKEQRRAELAHRFAQKINPTRYASPAMIFPYSNGMVNANYGYIPNQMTYNAYRQIAPRTIPPHIRPQQRWPMMQSSSINQNMYPIQRTNAMNPRIQYVPPNRATGNMIRPQPQQMSGYTSNARNTHATNASVQQNSVIVDQVQLTAANLANASPQQQKQMLGEHLYPLIQNLIGAERAGKITGMLLELDNTEVLHLIDSRDALLSKVSEAEHVLRVHMQRQAAAANTAVNNVNSQ